MNDTPAQTLAQSLLDLANMPNATAQLDSFRLAHTILDTATTVDQLKPVLELILLKLYERKL